ncbi:MAG: MarR family transcriptional regulator, partial [Chitinophagaceae bacterium]|nr:MarR family transcriptional regulator [Chitinophagaceae bacterium]
EKNSNIPRIIDKLEDKKLVKRLVSREDNRETLIRLTPAGISLLEASTKMVQPNTIRSLKLSEKESLYLNRLLDGITDSDN